MANENDKKAVCADVWIAGMVKLVRNAVFDFHLDSQCGKSNLGNGLLIACAHSLSGA